MNESDPLKVESVPPTEAQPPASDTLPSDALPALPSGLPQLTAPPASAGEVSGDFDERFPGSTEQAPYGYKMDGTPRKDPRGRKSKPLNRGPASITPNPAPKVKENPSIEASRPLLADYGALGRMAANLWFNVGVLCFGKEWEPDIASGESVAVSNAFRDYFAAKNMTALDPGTLLVITLGSYALIRAQRPTVKERMQRGWSWVNLKVFRRT